MPNMIRFFALAAVALLAVPLVGAVPENQRSVVVVYPFRGAQGVSPNIGSNVAVAVAQQLAQTGDITVKPAPDTAPADFLHTARGLGADYYVAGFVSPIGNQIAVIEQLVSTKSGVSVWRNTVALATPDDARDAAAQLHEAIVQLGQQQVPLIPNRTTAAAPPSAAPSAAPAKRVALAVPPIPLGAAVPLPTATPASRTTALVLHFGGDTLSAVKDYVPDAIVQTMGRYGIGGAKATVESGDLAKVGLLMCAQTGADVLFGGTIDSQQGDPALGWSFDADLNLKVFDCKNLTGKPRTIEATATNGNLQTAVDIAIAQALKQYSTQHITSRR